MINNMINQITVKLDSGATRHYFKDKHRQIITDLKKLENGPVAQLPNKSYVKATYEGILALYPTLLKAVQTVLIYPEVTNELLISVSQLAHDGCQITFDDNTAKIKKNDRVILEGYKNKSDQLYDINIPTIHQDKLNLII